nr:DUF302 domain-containing protein [Rhizobium altiplani]
MKKIDVDIDDYLILGAFRPHMAFEAMKLKPRVGAMLPGNVIVRNVSGGGRSERHPVASMRPSDNEMLSLLAGKARSMLADAAVEVWHRIYCEGRLPKPF